MPVPGSPYTAAVSTYSLFSVIFGLSVRLPQLLALAADRLGSPDLTDGAGLLLDLSLTFFAGMKLSAMVRRGL